jgi:hemerythrin
MNHRELIAALPQLDAEHAKLRELGADVARYCPRLAENTHCALCDNLMASECADIVLNTLSVLASHWAMHSINEEALMRRACPQRGFKKRFGAHLEDHAALSAQLAKLSAKMPAMPPSDVIVDILGLTRRMLDEHVTTHDNELIQLISMAPD